MSDDFGSFRSKIQNYLILSLNFTYIERMQICILLHYISAHTVDLIYHTIAKINI